MIGKSYGLLSGVSGGINFDNLVMSQFFEDRNASDQEKSFVVPSDSVLQMLFVYGPGGHGVGGGDPGGGGGGGGAFLLSSGLAGALIEYFVGKPDSSANFGTSSYARLPERTLTASGGWNADRRSPAPGGSGSGGLINARGGQGGSSGGPGYYSGEYGQYGGGGAVRGRYNASGGGCGLLGGGSGSDSYRFASSSSNEVGGGGNYLNDRLTEPGEGAFRCVVFTER